MGSQLPESVHVQHWIVPSILPTAVSSTSCFHMDVLPDSGLESGIVHNSRIRDERHREVRMIMRVNDWSSGNYFLGLLLSTPLPNLLRKKHTSSVSFLAARRFFVFLIFFCAIYWVKG